ncbi:MAG TPA: MBL fold metallo-hydrolase [Candidatus Acidoferrales bacterium]
MKITFVNHASFLLEAAKQSVWCDPWTFGKVCNECCSLHSPSPPIPYDNVQYIWISHEHPDHFNFPTLRAIPEADRRRITILYQKHSSPRLVDAFKRLGFVHIVELPLYRWLTLKPGFDVLCGSVGTMDSFLAVRADGECMLNLNDCICTDRQLRYIRRLVGDVSVLFTQFSFANWIGNQADETDAVGQKLRELQYRVALFRPEFTVPFASLGYFSSQENSWMNAFVITPAQIAAMNLPGVNFMYPGDEWDSATRVFQSAKAVARYSEDFARAEITPTPPSVDDEKVKLAVLHLIGALKTRFGRVVLRRVEPFEIYTHDTNRIFAVFPGQGRCEIRTATPESAAQARYVMCSQVAWFTFAHTWGWNVMEGAGPYLDREFTKKGGNDLLRRCITELSTDILRFNTPERAVRTVGFLWGKKLEILYRFLGKPITEDVLRGVMPRGTDAAVHKPLADARIV